MWGQGRPLHQVGVLNGSGWCSTYETMDWFSSNSVQRHAHLGSRVCRSVLVVNGSGGEMKPSHEALPWSLASNPIPLYRFMAAHCVIPFHTVIFLGHMGCESPCDRVCGPSCTLRTLDHPGVTPFPAFHSISTAAALRTAYHGSCRYSKVLGTLTACLRRLQNNKRK